MKTETLLSLAMVAFVAAEALYIHTGTGKSCSAMSCKERCVGGRWSGVCDSKGQCVCATRLPQSRVLPAHPAVDDAAHPKGRIRRKRGEACCPSRCSATCWSTGIAIGGSCLNNNECHCIYVGFK